MDAVVAKAKELRIDFVFVAPDDPLAWGLADRIREASIAAFGPSKTAAALESSKSWAKQMMAAHNIPHTRTLVFDDAEAARDYVLSTTGPVVVKADGPAVGKGAIVTSTREEALAAIDELVGPGRIGKAPDYRGPHYGTRGFRRTPSATARPFAPMPLSCDHKAVFDGNLGPNTGGMGVYSPPWWADASLADEDLASHPLAHRQRYERRGPALRGHRLPRRLRQRKRHAGLRVQRALRRPRDAGAARPPQVGPA